MFLKYSDTGFEYDGLAKAINTMIIKLIISFFEMCMIFLMAANARINCGVNLATFLRVFAKKMTGLRSQI
jgi:hypothetical protein